jgi:hypothetical protein
MPHLRKISFFNNSEMTVNQCFAKKLQKEAKKNRKK